MKVPYCLQYDISYCFPEGIDDAYKKMATLQAVRLRKPLTMAVPSRHCPFNAGSGGDEIGNCRKWIANRRVENIFFNSPYEVDLPVFRCVRVSTLKQPKNVLDENGRRFVGLLSLCP